MELLFAKTQIGDAFTVKAMLTEGKVKTDVRDESGNTPLHIAAQEGFTPVINVLLSFGADPCALNNRGLTTLMCAIEKGHVFAAKKLVGATYNTKFSTSFLINHPREGGDRSSPLGVAAVKGSSSIVEFLLSHGDIHIDVCNNSGETPLFQAAEHNHPEIISLLLKAGVNPNISSNFVGASPLAEAAVHGCTAAVHALLAHKDVKIDAQDNMGKTALYRSASHGHHDIVKSLLIAGADPNLTDSKNYTPLMAASIRGFYDTVQTLIAYKANVNAISEDWGTALQMAARMNYIKVAKFLIESGSDKDICDHLGNTPVMWAAQYGRSQLTEMFIKSGCDITCVDRRGRSLLHHAAFFGWTKLVKKLLDRGLDPCIQNHSGNMPMVLAIRNNHFYVVKLLLDHNCAVHVGGFCNKKWSPLLGLALERGRKDICELLYKAGCCLERASVESIVQNIHPLHPRGAPDMTWINSILESPRSLNNACRYAVRKSLGRDLRSDVESLMLPKSIKGFILLDDVICEDDKDGRSGHGNDSNDQDDDDSDGDDGRMQHPRSHVGNGSLFHNHDVDDMPYIGFLRSGRLLSHSQHEDDDQEFYERVNSNSEHSSDDDDYLDVSDSEDVSEDGEVLNHEEEDSENEIPNGVNLDKTERKA